MLVDSSMLRRQSSLSTLASALNRDSRNGRNGIHCDYYHVLSIFVPFLIVSRNWTNIHMTKIIGTRDSIFNSENHVRSQLPTILCQF